LIVFGLDGKEHKWNPKSGGGKRSKLHTRAKQLLDELFPHDRVLEEVSLPGTRTTKNSMLRADLFVPNRNLIVEVHGQQHFKFNKFHFKDKLSFFRAQARDRKKSEWCEVNEIRFIEFNYNEDIDEWRRKIE
jgi:hypothetical protein